MYEHKKHHLLPWPRFVRRAWLHLLVGVVIVILAVAGGTIGYHWAGEGTLNWADAFLNASMILSGMGPVDKMPSDAGKIFASFYALFSGIVFIGVMGIVLAPWAHRLLHATGLDDK